MIDFVCELSNLLADVRAYSRGIFGTYPWERYQSQTFVLDKRSYLRFVTEFLRYKPDICILLASETFVSMSIFSLAKIVKSRIVLVVEENEERTFPSLAFKMLSVLKSKLVSAVHRGADLIIAESETSRDYVLRMGCDPALVFALPHGVNVEDFRPGPKRSELALRIGLNFEDLKKRIVLFVGNYNAYKGAEFMTEAILKSPTKAELLFLIPDKGSVFSKHADVLRALPDVYPYPPIDDAEMPDLYNLADIVVVPSMRCPGTSSDRSPNSLLEAMACGKAVIGTNVGGIPLILGDAGLLIPPNDSDAIVEALTALTADVQLRRSLQEKARARAVAELSNKAYAERVLELLRSKW